MNKANLRSAAGREVLLIPGLTAAPVPGERFVLPEIISDRSQGILCTATTLARVEKLIPDLSRAERICVLPSPAEMWGPVSFAEQVLLSLLENYSEPTLAANWFIEDPRYETRSLPFYCGVTRRLLLLGTIRHKLSYYEHCLPIRHLLDPRYRPIKQAS